MDRVNVVLVLAVLGLIPLYAFIGYLYFLRKKQKT